MNCNEICTSCVNECVEVLYFMVRWVDQFPTSKTTCLFLCTIKLSHVVVNKYFDSSNVYSYEFGPKFYHREETTPTYRHT